MCDTLRGMNDEWLTREEAAAYLKINPRTLNRWVQHGKCPRHRTPGGAPRFLRRELDELLRPDPPRGGRTPATL